MSRQNLSASTDSTYPYPPYISINLETFDHVTVAVRGPAEGQNCGPYASISMTRSIARAVLKEALDNLDRSE